MHRSGSVPQASGRRSVARRPPIGASSLAIAGFVAAFGALVCLGVPGCGGPDERLAPVTPMHSLPQSPDYLEGMVRADAGRWTTLTADCRVLINNPQIPGPSNQVALGEGRLLFRKPSRVKIVAPATGQPGLTMTGDGRLYEVNLAVFNDRYRGFYTDPVRAQARRIHLGPAEVADALNPARLLTNRARAVTQWEQLSALYLIEMVEEPEPAIRITGTILLDRAMERIATVETYHTDGSVKARVRYLAADAVRNAADEAVFVPTSFAVTYPVDQTAVLFQLANVKLDVEIDPAEFQLGQ